MNINEHVLPNYKKGGQYLTACFDEQTRDSNIPQKVQALDKTLLLFSVSFEKRYKNYQ